MKGNNEDKNFIEDFKKKHPDVQLHISLEKAIQEENLYDKLIVKDKKGEELNKEELNFLEVFYKTVPTGFDKEITVIDDIDIQLAQRAVEKLSNERVDIVEYNKRYYPNKHLASNVIGYVKLISSKEYESLKDSGYTAQDQIGKKGIEKQYDTACLSIRSVKSITAPSFNPSVSKSICI